MSDLNKIYLKVQKNRKLIFVEVSQEDSVESLKTVVKSLFPKQEMSEIQLFRGEVLLNESSMLKDQGLQCGDCIGVRFFRVVRPGNPPEWDALDSAA